MKRKGLLISLVLMIILIGLLNSKTYVDNAKAQFGTIYIRADGSIEGTTAILTNDSRTYTLTNNINDSIVIQRDNVVVDGVGYTLQGNGSGTGMHTNFADNVTMKNMNIKGFYTGVYLDHCSGNYLYANNISNNIIGIELFQSSSNIVSENNVINHNVALSIWGGGSTYNLILGNNVTSSNREGFRIQASYNYILENRIADTKYGIDLYSGRNNLYGNDIINNTYGIRLGVEPSRASNNVLRNNNMTKNQFHLSIYGLGLSSFINDIDNTNTIDGKQVYYLVSKQNLDIPSNAGFVALINCTRITVQNTTITNNSPGILLVSTTNSTITKNRIMHNEGGIKILVFSDNNKVTGNDIMANIDAGVEVYNSRENTLSGNNMMNNTQGVWLLDWNSANNTISGNNIVENDEGIKIWVSGDNLIYHNNFVNNLQQTILDWSAPNSWDNRGEGNYWNDYSKMDHDHDGIGDTAYTMDSGNTDNYPLMGMFSSFNTSLGEYVNVISNSSIEDFEYFESNSTIKMYVSNMTGNQTHGFVRICIPHDLMAEPFNITIDGVNPTYWNYTLQDNGTHRWIYFAYEHSTLEIIIVPEFPQLIILPLFMTLTLLAALAKKKKGKVYKPSR